MDTYLLFRGGVPWLSLLIFLPLLGAILAAAWPQGDDGRAQKWGTFLLSLAPLGIALFIAATYYGMSAEARVVAGEPNQQVYDFAERLPWLSVLGAEYKLGVDGISLPLVLLTTLMTPIAIVAAWNQHERPAFFFALILLMETAMLGVFLSLNFILFFIFWEISLIPGYYLISAWGRDPEQRRYAAFKFFVYTMAGSVSMLLAFEFFYLATRFAGRGTFDLVELTRLSQGLPVAGVQGNLSDLVFTFLDRSLGVVRIVGGSPYFYMSILFLGVFIALAIKLAVWPFHTWLPDAYSEAPTAASMLIAGVLTKMGAYAMLRLMLPIFPQQMQQGAIVLGFFAVMSIIVGAWVAYNIARAPVRRERKLNDLKRVISYLSINHMGYVMLAIAAAGAAATADASSRAIALNGAVMQMFAHGLSTGALFFLAGILAERTGSYELTSFGGLRMVVPVFAGMMGVAMFANLGLPGMAGFVGEFFIFRGTWATLPVWTIFAMLGLVISALALLLMFQRIFSGPVNQSLRRLPDITRREAFVLVPLLGLLIVFGVYPLPLMSLANETALALVRFFAGA